MLPSAFFFFFAEPSSSFKKDFPRLKGGTSYTHYLLSYANEKKSRQDKTFNKSFQPFLYKLVNFMKVMGDDGLPSTRRVKDLINRSLEA